MPNLDESLGRLIGDEQRVKQILGLAQAIAGSTEASAAAPSTDIRPAPQPDPADSELGATQLISALLAQPREEQADEYGWIETEAHEPPGSTSGGGLAAMAEVLPQLLQAFSGDCSALPHEKINLVKAIRPYAHVHEASIDRAIKMASIAKVAKNALGALGRQ